MAASPPLGEAAGLSRETLLSELAGGSRSRARRTERHLDVAEQVRAVLSGDNGVEGFADVVVIRMRAQAEAQARPASQQPLGALDHRLDLRPANDLTDGRGGRPQALDRVGDGLSDSPADLGQGVGKLSVPAICHLTILPPGRCRGQGMSVLVSAAVLRRGPRSCATWRRARYAEEAGVSR
jgi:hypothetical protein